MHSTLACDLHLAVHWTSVDLFCSQGTFLNEWWVDGWWFMEFGDSSESQEVKLLLVLCAGDPVDLSHNPSRPLSPIFLAAIYISYSWLAICFASSPPRPPQISSSYHRKTVYTLAWGPPVPPMSFGKYLIKFQQQKALMVGLSNTASQLKIPNTSARPFVIDSIIEWAEKTLNVHLLPHQPLVGKSRRRKLILPAVGRWHLIQLLGFKAINVIVDSTLLIAHKQTKGEN